MASIVIPLYLPNCGWGGFIIKMEIYSQVNKEAVEGENE